MLPLVLTPKSAKIGLIGAGEALVRRRSFLTEAGIAPVELAPEADFSGVAILFVAGLSPDQNELLAARARRSGILVNVEDVPPLCDFHVPAVVRRGDLLFSVSTAGRSPALARRLREWLQTRFGPEWVQRSGELGDLRDAWRGEGVSPGDIAERSRNIIEEKGWLR